MSTTCFNQIILDFWTKKHFSPQKIPFSVPALYPRHVNENPNKFKLSSTTKSGRKLHRKLWSWIFYINNSIIIIIILPYAFIIAWSINAKKNIKFLHGLFGFSLKKMHNFIRKKFYKMFMIIILDIPCAWRCESHLGQLVQKVAKFCLEKNIYNKKYFWASSF